MSIATYRITVNQTIIPYNIPRCDIMNAKDGKKKYLEVGEKTVAIIHPMRLWEELRMISSRQVLRAREASVEFGYHTRKNEHKNPSQLDEQQSKSSRSIPWPHAYTFLSFLSFTSGKTQKRKVEVERLDYCPDSSSDSPSSRSSSPSSCC